MFSSKAKEKRKKKSNVTFYILDDAFTVKHSIYNVLNDEAVKKNMRANFYAIGEGILYEELRDTLHKNKADLYFLDTELEDGTGWDLVPLIKETHKNAHIIMLSDGLNPALKSKRQQYESEVFTVIEKPFQPGIIVGALNELISFIDSHEELNKSKEKPKKASEELSKNTFVPASKKSQGGFTTGVFLGKKSSLSEVKPFSHKSRTEKENQPLNQIPKESSINPLNQNPNALDFEQQSQHHMEDFSEKSAPIEQQDDTNLLFGFDDDDFNFKKDEKEINNESNLIKSESLLSNSNSEVSKNEFFDFDNYSKMSKDDFVLSKNEESLLTIDDDLSFNEFDLVKNDEKVVNYDSKENIYDVFGDVIDEKTTTNDELGFVFDDELGNLLSKNEEKQEKRQEEAITLDEIQFSEGFDREMPIFEENEQNDEFNFFEDNSTFSEDKEIQVVKNDFDFEFKTFDGDMLEQTSTQQVCELDEAITKEEDDFLFFDLTSDESPLTSNKATRGDIAEQEFVFEMNDDTAKNEQEDLFFDFSDSSENVLCDNSFLNNDNDFFGEDFNSEKKSSPTIESFDFNFDLSENDVRENNYQEFGDESSLDERADFTTFEDSPHLNFEYSNQDYAYSDESNQEFYFSNSSTEESFTEDEFSFNTDEQIDEVDDWGNDEEEFFIRPPMKRF